MLKAQNFQFQKDMIFGKDVTIPPQHSYKDDYLTRNLKKHPKPSD
jgi:hypothetical protein